MHSGDTIAIVILQIGPRTALAIYLTVLTAARIAVKSTVCNDARRETTCYHLLFEQDNTTCNTALLACA